jgi:hypothetical protein
METQDTAKTKRKLVRKRRIDLQLQAALNDAAAAIQSGADAATMSLLQTRLNILNQRLHKDENAKIRRAIEEAKRLRVESIERKRQQDQDAAEIMRLRLQISQPRADEPLEEKSARLIQQFEAGEF